MLKTNDQLKSKRNCKHNSIQFKHRRRNWGRRRCAAGGGGGDMGILQFIYYYSMLQYIIYFKVFIGPDYQ